MDITCDVISSHMTSIVSSHMTSIISSHMTSIISNSVAKEYATKRRMICIRSVLFIIIMITCRCNNKISSYYFRCYFISINDENQLKFYYHSRSMIIPLNLWSILSSSTLQHNTLWKPIQFLTLAIFFVLLCSYH